MITLQRAVLSPMEICVAYRVSEKFLARWSSLEADRDFKAQRSTIPACPCIRTEGKSVTGYPVGRFEEWFFRYFGTGYGCGEPEGMTSRSRAKTAAGDCEGQRPKGSRCERCAPAA